MKNDLWKGIAIAGIWIGAATTTWAVAMVHIYQKSLIGSWDASPIWIMAFIMTWLIKKQQ